MKLLVAAAIVAAFSLVQAKEVGRFVPQLGTEIRLFDDRGDCPHEKLVRIELHANGQRQFEGCAYDDGDMVFIRWSDGDIGQVARKMFAPGV